MNGSTSLILSCVLTNLLNLTKLVWNMLNCNRENTRVQCSAFLCHYIKKKKKKCHYYRNKVFYAIIIVIKFNYFKCSDRIFLARCCRIIESDSEDEKKFGCIADISDEITAS